jgi:hypothetical protein
VKFLLGRLSFFTLFLTGEKVKKVKRLEEKGTRKKSKRGVAR